MNYRLCFAVMVAALLPTVPALADDWIAQRLYGPVQQQVAGQWVAVTKGSSIPDGNPIRTLGGGRVTLVRGTETVELAANTELVIQDRGGSKPYTTVIQRAGTISVEADVRNVQHFEVDTPYMAAVVKGTRFSVTSSKSQSTVSVRRGHVHVESNADHSSTTLSVGQTATTGATTDGTLEVAGAGDLPAVIGANGKALGVTEKGAKGNAYGIAKQAADPGNGAGVGDGAGNGDGGSNGNGNANGHNK